eukprot:Colp12_sorted_trinity150504_noHs@31885
MACYSLKLYTNSGNWQREKAVILKVSKEASFQNLRSRCHHAVYGAFNPASRLFSLQGVEIASTIDLFSNQLAAVVSSGEPFRNSVKNCVDLETTDRLGQFGPMTLVNKPLSKEPVFFSCANEKNARTSPLESTSLTSDELILTPRCQVDDEQALALFEEGDDDTRNAQATDKRAVRRLTEYKSRQRVKEKVKELAMLLPTLATRKRCSEDVVVAEARRVLDQLNSEQEGLQKSQQRFQEIRFLLMQEKDALTYELVMMLPPGFETIDYDRTYLFCDPVWERFMGFSLDQIRFKPCHNTVDLPYPERDREVVQAMRAHQPWKGLRFGRTAYGMPYISICHVFPVGAIDSLPERPPAQFHVVRRGMREVSEEDFATLAAIAGREPVTVPEVHADGRPAVNDVGLPLDYWEFISPSEYVKENGGLM